MRALVEVSGRRLGDLALDMPLLLLLARKYPDLDLEIVLSEHLASIVEDCAFVHWKHMLPAHGASGRVRVGASILLSTWNLVVLGEASRIRWLRPLLRSELILDPNSRAEEARAEGALIHRLSAVRSVIPDWREDVATGIPLLEGRAEHALRLAGLAPAERVLVLAPGADQSPHLPVATAVAAVDLLRSDFDRIVVMGRAADARHCVSVATAVGCQALAGSVPMPYNCALLKQTAMLIGSDECMAHVAASYGTPTLLVGAPADLYRHPWRQQSIAGSADAISADAIAEHARSMLAHG